ncbi:ATP-binding protein [Rugosimonospora africana]|uniref:ATP-binding protein n=1 Tax=Rugosimonospora africana TaxID=556532 RepID=UPI00194303C2|nr:LuxR C-terminal-related transcriptional regulator [Rugosimonospora africana]
MAARAPDEPLERSVALAEMSRSLAECAEEGRIVLVTGEAGIGRSTLVRHFAQQRPGVGEPLIGLCDPLTRSRPLGPLYDIARQCGGRLAEVLASHGSDSNVFSALLDEVCRRGRTVVVFEDVHWADSATLGLLAFIGRRLDRVPALVVLTYRDDDLRTDHPLYTVLAGLPARLVRQIPLHPLSPAAVDVLARRKGAVGGDLYRLTGGNPLLVSEVLAADDEAGTPARVQALVQTRLAGLAEPAQQMIRLLAASPSGLDRGVLAKCGADDPAAQADGLATGLLVQTEEQLGFRYELLRRTVYGLLPIAVRRELNRAILDVLVASDADPARLAHHAAECGDEVVVLRYARMAGRRAAAGQSHRAAADHFKAALRYADQLSCQDRAELWELFAEHTFWAGDAATAIDARRAAVAIRQQLAQPAMVADNLRWLSRLFWWAGRRQDAERAAVSAVELLERTGTDGRQLALAYGNRAELGVQTKGPSRAIRWAAQALDVAERLHDSYAVAHALTDLGTARLAAGLVGGRDDLHRAHALARRHGLAGEAVRALTRLATYGVEQRDPRASGDLQRALRFATDHELLPAVRYLTAVRSRLRLDRGDWSGAEEDVRTALARPLRQGPFAAIALAVLGRVRARLGEPSAVESLRAANAQAVDADLRRKAPVTVAWAEYAWLTGAALDRGDLTSAFRLASRARHPWYAGELAWWLRRAGADPPVREWYAEPYRLLLNGDWRRAAQAWEDLACPYEQAEALASGSDPDGCLRALRLLDVLGAHGAARMLRRRMRALGELRIPRGPRPATAANPAGLTVRQAEVLRLLSVGLSNGEIAARLTLSERTVEHHVAAVLAKLSVGSRRAAATAAQRLGLVAAELGGPADQSK